MAHSTDDGKGIMPLLEKCFGGGRACDNPAICAIARAVRRVTNALS